MAKRQRRAAKAAPQAEEQSAQPQPKPKRKIAIIGTAPSSFKLAPYDDPTWEIWALKVWNIKRWDVFFEIHEATEGVKRWPKQYIEWLTQEHKDEDGNLKPMFTQGQVMEWPNSRPYPLHEVITRYGKQMGRQMCNYFTNQVSYMIALAAMQEDVAEIGLWGVDMAQHGVGGRSEYAHQRPSCEYFLGVAAGAGIQIYVPPQSDLLKSRKLYAFEQDDFGDKLKAREKELRQRMNQAEHESMMKQRERDHLAGALENVSWYQQWMQVGMPEAKAEDK